MLGTIPRIKPEVGESAYSLVATYHAHSPYACWQQTNQTLFDVTHVRLHPVLTAHLTQLAHAFGLSPASLLTTGTGYPLYAAVLGDDAIPLRTLLLGTQGGRVATAAKHSGCALPLTQVLKYCPDCVLADQVRTGRRYWHTVHQLYGVSWCPTHHCPLLGVPTGEGSSYRQYLLPEKGTLVDMNTGQAASKARYLSGYIAKWYALMQQSPPRLPLSTYYHHWLACGDYLTPKNRLRAKQLKQDLYRFWAPLFDVPERTLPLELFDFRSVSQRVRYDNATHYLKHVLIMAFLTRQPNVFFSTPAQLKPQLAQTQQEHKAPDEVRIKTLLTDKHSLRQVAVITGHSVSTVKQVALRKGIEINRRRQRISSEDERTVWRQAFYGLHRQEIAMALEISTGAVEQIMQSHPGLTAWRRHLKAIRLLITHRDALRTYLDTHPKQSRNQIKQQCLSYMWLYKHDKQWLYQHLPSPQTARYHASVDWTQRDRFLAVKVQFLISEACSLSALDRELGGHQWLIKYPSKLPLTMRWAHRRVTENKHK